MWLSRKLKLIQPEAGYTPGGSKDEKWVIISLKAGYKAKTFPSSSMENFYKFTASLTNDPVGIYKIEYNQTFMPDDTYIIGEVAPPEKKIWKYERNTQQLFFGTMVTMSGTPQTQNKATDEINYDLVLKNVIAITNGFALNSGNGQYSTGNVLRKSWTEKPFKEKGIMYWESA